VLPLLKRMKLERGANVLLFPGVAGRHRSKVGVSKPFKRAVIAAGLPARLRPHDLRHSFAIQYLHDDGDLHRLSRILGHSTVITTERAYLAYKPTNFELDYGRVRFAMPSEGKVIRMARE
jgi:integrase